MLILTDVLLSFVLDFEWGSNGWGGLEVTTILVGCLYVTVLTYSLYYYL